MKSVPAFLALAALLAMTTAPARAQSAALEELGVACSGNPHFFDFAVSGLESDNESLTRLCGCLVTQFTAYTDPELVMLTKDIKGTSTDADRTAYGDYTALELKARGSLDKCLVSEGFSDTADMAGFETACVGSELMLVAAGDVAGAEERRGELCSCLVAALATKISTADAEILATDLDGTATPASHDAYENYANASNLAGQAFEACVAQIEGSPPPETAQ